MFRAFTVFHGGAWNLPRSIITACAVMTHANMLKEDPWSKFELEWSLVS